MGIGNAAAGAGSGAAAGAFGGPIGALIGAGIGLFGSLFGAHQQAKSVDKQTAAEEHAAQMQADAAKYAADLTSKAQAQSLAFTKSQAENAFQNNEVGNRNSYAQDAARQRRLGSLGEILGFGKREIPEYIPGVDPGFGATTAPQPGMAQTASAAPGGAPMAGGGQPLTEQAFMGLTNGLAPTPANLQALAPKLAAFGYKPIANASGVYGKIQGPNGIVDVLQSAGTGGTAWQFLGGGGSTSPQRPQAMASYLPMAPAPTTSPLMIPQGPWSPQSLYGYLGG